MIKIGGLSWFTRARGLAAALLLSIFALAGAAGAQGELLRVDATGPVKLSADKVTFDERTSSYIAEGDVVVTRGETKLEADRVRLFTETLVAEAEGNARLTGTGQAVEGKRILIDLKGNTGKIYKGTIFIQANHFFLRGDEIEKTGADTYRMSRGSFTSCDGANPAWSLAGNDLNVTVEGYGTARNAAFRIKGFPVLWSPYMIFPVKFKRQSGLLTPMAGYSNRDGVIFSQPYFQTLGESMDATVTLTGMSLRGLDLGLEFRYALTPESKGMIMLDYLFKDYKGDDLFESGQNAEAYNSRYWLRGMFTQTLGPWSIRADIDKVSDQDYLREFTFGHTGFNATNDRLIEWFQRGLDPETSLTRTSRLNVTRSWAAWSFNAALIYYDNTATDNQTTLQSLPTITLDALRQEIGDTGIYFQMSSSYTYYYRPESSTGHILNISPAVLYPFNLGPYLEVEPKVTLFSRMYSVTLGENESDDDDLKKTGFSNLWRLDVSTSSYLYRVYSLGEGPKATLVKHAIRPYMEYAYQPAMEETDVAALARRNSTRINRVSYGIRNTFTSKKFPPRKAKAKPQVQPKVQAPGQSTGQFPGQVPGQSQTEADEGPEPVYRDFLKITFSHSFDINEYRRADMFTDTEVTNDDGTTTTVTEEVPRRPWGNLNLRIQFDPNRYIYWESDASFDPYETIFSSFNTLLRLTDTRGDSVTLDYRYADGGVNQLDSELRLAITSEWALSYINRTDFENNNQIENTFQISYTGQCWGLRVFYTSTDRDSGVYVAFSLGGLGEVFGLGNRE